VPAEVPNPTSPVRSTTLPPGPLAWSNPFLRVSDADRAQIADQLARHYSDGRLDQAEFDERLDRAMRATTVADLSGLLADLPGEQVAKLADVPPGEQAGKLAGERPGDRLEPRRQPRARSSRPGAQLALFAVFSVTAFLVLRAVTHLIVAAVVLAVIAVILLRRRSGRDHRESGD
jgi:hypothetical protein